LLRTTGHSRLPFLPDQVGGAWTRRRGGGVSAQVDVVGINLMEKTLILGECKWSPKAMEQDVLEALVQKTAEFVPSEGHWRIYYLGFARGGWQREAQSFAKMFGKAKVKGENWQAIGMSLLDLDGVDQDLKDWSESKEDDVEIIF
jgi:hypothetical protein